MSKTKGNKTDKSEITMGDLNDKLNIILGKFEEIESRITNMEEKISECLEGRKDVNKLMVSDIAIRKKIKNLEGEIEFMHRRENRNKLIISGIPEEAGEIIVDKIIKLGKSANVIINSKDMVRVIRFSKGKDEGGNVEVNFENTSLRDTFLKEVKKARPNSGKVFNKGRTNIYVNEKYSYNKK